MRDFLLYLALIPDRPDFFTFLGGLRTASPDFLRALTETDDFSKSSRLLVPGSGQSAVNIAAEGVASESDELQRILIQINQSGRVVPAKLDSASLTITGNFAIQNLKFSESYDSDSQFSIELSSSGEVTINKK